MMLRRWWTVLFAMVSSGCLVTDVSVLELRDGGSACTPVTSQCGDGGACAVSNEISLQTEQSGCVSGACMTYRWDQTAHPEERARRVFCTCACDGPNACACPGGYRCERVFDVPAEGARSYCVPTELQ